MKKRANASKPAQVGAGLLFTAQQLLLPMIEGIIHSRRELFGWVQQVGISALKELFELEVVQLAGPKGKHSAERSHYRWGVGRDRTAVRWAAHGSCLSPGTRLRRRRGATEKRSSVPRG